MYNMAGIYTPSLCIRHYFSWKKKGDISRGGRRDRPATAGRQGEECGIKWCARRGSNLQPSDSKCEIKCLIVEFSNEVNSVEQRSPFFRVAEM